MKLSHHIRAIVVARTPTMSSFRLSRAALRARPAAIFNPVQRRGYADAVSDKIKLSLALPHQVCPFSDPSSTAKGTLKASPNGNASSTLTFFLCRLSTSLLMCTCPSNPTAQMVQLEVADPSCFSVFKSTFQPSLVRWASSLSTYHRSNNSNPAWWRSSRRAAAANNSFVRDALERRSFKPSWTNE